MPFCIGLLKTSCVSDCVTQFSDQLADVLTVCKSCRHNGINEYFKKQQENNLQESMQPSSTFSFVLSSLLCSFLLTCCHSTFVFIFFHFRPSPHACTTSSFPTFFPCLLLSLPRHVSPLSFLFYALSDMSQDSSDEDSEEEEDFSRVQFGSRYSAAQCVCVCVCLLSFVSTACFSGPRRLTANCAQTHQGRVVKNELMKASVWQCFNYMLCS